MPFLQGIHADAKNEWLQRIDTRMNHFLSQPYPSFMDILCELQTIAEGVHGIGDNSIYETLAYILDEQAKANRGF